MGLFDKLKKNNKSPEEDARKFSRSELLEMLIEETKEAERLKAENERLSAELTRCKEDLDRTASLAVIISKLEDIVSSGAKPAERTADPDAEQDSFETAAEDTQAVVRQVSAALAMQGFRYTTRDPQGEAERAAKAEAQTEPYPPLGVAVPIRMVGFRLAGQKKWEA